MSRVRREREHCCDDAAVRGCGDRLLYARALAALEELRAAGPAPFALGATGGRLLARIQRILRPPPRGGARPGRLAVAAVAALLLVGAAAFWYARDARAADAAREPDDTKPPAAAPARERENSLVIRAKHDALHVTSGNTTVSTSAQGVVVTSAGKRLEGQELKLETFGGEVTARPGRITIVRDGDETVLEVADGQVRVRTGGQTIVARELVMTLPARRAASEPPANEQPATRPLGRRQPPPPPGVLHLNPSSLPQTEGSAFPELDAFRAQFQLQRGWGIEAFDAGITRPATRPAAGPVFRGIDLANVPVTDDTSKLPDVWEEVPPGSNSYEVRGDVVVSEQLIDGQVFHLPERDVFYVQHDTLGSSRMHYYGPIKGNPFAMLGVKRWQPDTADLELKRAKAQAEMQRALAEAHAAVAPFNVRALTAHAYGVRRMPIACVLDADGTLRHAQVPLNMLGEVLK